MPDGRDADVVVVGGGIQGCAAAYYAAARGLRVVLIERDRIGAGTAAASGWAVMRQTKQDAALLELTERSAQRWRDLARDAGIPYREDGSYLLYRDSGEAAVVESRVAWLRQHEVDVRMLGASELRQAQPCVREDVMGASHVRSDGEVDPVSACRALAAAARVLGADVVERSIAEEVLVGDRGVTGVRLGGEIVNARAVVLACGPSTPMMLKRLGVRPPLRLQKGEQLVTAPTRRVMQGRMVSARYLASKRVADSAAEAPSVGLAVGQGPDGRIRIGSTRERSCDTRATTAAREALLAEAGRYLTIAASVPIERQTVGLRVLSETGRPLVGPVEGVDGLSMMTGHGGDGVTLAPLSGALIAAWAAGEGPGTQQLGGSGQAS